MKKLFFITIFCTIMSFVTPTYGFQPTAIDPHVEVLTPGVTRYYTITQVNSYPQDFSFFLVFFIGYGVADISMSTFFHQEKEGNLLFINGWALSSAGTVPIIKFGRLRADLSVGVEVGSERSPFGIMWFSSWIAGPIEEGGVTYDLSIGF